MTASTLPTLTLSRVEIYGQTIYLRRITLLCGPGETSMNDASDYIYRSAANTTVYTQEHPESSSHATVQTKRANELIEMSRARKVVITSNSDHVFNALRVAVRSGLVDSKEVAFYFFPPGESPAELLEIDEAGRFSHWPVGFFDENERNLDLLLTPTRKKVTS